MHHGLNLVYLFVFFLIRGLYLCDRDIVSDWGHSWEIFSQLIFFSRLDESVKDPSLPKSPPRQIGVLGWVVIGQHYRMFSTFLVRTLQFGSWQCCTTAILDGCSSLCRLWVKQEVPVDSTSFKLTFSSIGRKSAQIIGSQISANHWQEIRANHLSFIMMSAQLFYFHSWEGKKVQ